ncbi:MAG: hypothetical protein KY475_27685 [Planctomycetes bacterium]|nr:hypothetical protein [Planctomycetota bacterium]
MRSYSLIIFAAAVTAIGCEDFSGGGGARRSMSPEAVGVAPGTVQDYGAPVSPAPTEENAPAAQIEARPVEQTPAQPAPVEATAPPEEAAPVEPSVTEEPVREKAEVGVGVKGQNLREGVITTPAKTFFRVQERLIFQQVEQALQLYKATEGRLPQSHDEFMQKVIQPNRIQLPELPAGARYVWDPQKGELMVER